MSRYDFNTSLELRDELRDSFKIAQTQLGALGTQLGAWLVLGNGAGIYFLANAAVENRLATSAQFQHLYALFVAGGALAFAAMCWTYFMSLPLLSIISKLSVEILLQAQREQLTVELESKGSRPPPEFETWEQSAERTIADLNRRLQSMWLLFGGAIGIYLLSAICFMSALAAPLFGGIAINPAG